MGSDMAPTDFKEVIEIIDHLCEAMLDIRSSALSPNAGGSKWYRKLDQIRTHAEELLKAYDEESS